MESLFSEVSSEVVEKSLNLVCKVLSRVKMGPNSRHDLYHCIVMHNSSQGDNIARSDLMAVLRHGHYLQDKLMLEEENSRW